MEKENNIGERLDICLSAKNMKRADLARALDIGQNSIFKWYHGFIPSSELLIRVSDYFGVSPKWLLWGEESEENKVINEHNAIITLWDSLKPELQQELLKYGEYLKTKE